MFVPGTVFTVLPRARAGSPAVVEVVDIAVVDIILPIRDGREPPPRDLARRRARPTAEAAGWS